MRFIMCFITAFYHAAHATKNAPTVLVEACGLFVFVVLTELCIFLNRSPLLWLWLSFLEAIVTVMLSVEFTLILECLAHGLVPLWCV